MKNYCSMNQKDIVFLHRLAVSRRQINGVWLILTAKYDGGYGLSNQWLTIEN